MGDAGDYWREHRDRRRKYRSTFHECPNCVFGGNARKIAPGMKCLDCGWETPEHEKKRQALGQSALRLKKVLFGEVHTVEPLGHVGVGERELIVLIHCSKRKWKGPVHEKWEGTPVKWKFNVGPFVALGAAA